MKKTFTTYKNVRTEQQTEIELFERPRFFQRWNFRELVAIFPEPYDFSDMGGDKGLRFYIFLAEDKKLSSMEIWDSDLAKFEKERDGKMCDMEKIFQIIVHNQQYDGEIGNESIFMGYYNTFKDKIVINNNK